MTLYTQQQVRLAARMYEIRDLVRRLHRERYRDALQPFAEIIQEVMAKQKIDALDVLPFLVRDLGRVGKELSGMEVLMFTAATVEIVEPSA